MKRAFTAQELFNEAAREVSYRMVVYPRLIGEEKLTLREARRRIALMVKIAQIFEAETEKERLP